MIIYLIYIGLLLYWEVVFHIGCFGFSVSSPWIMLGLLSGLAAIQALITGLFRKKNKRKVFWVFSIADYMVFAVQTVYYTIFKQPLQFRAMVEGGGDALTNYWREALMGILKSLPLLLILGWPLVAIAYFLYREGRLMSIYKSIQRVRMFIVFGVSLLVYWTTLVVGKTVDADYYYEYKEFYDPMIIMKDMGVVAMVQRDISFELEQTADKALTLLGFKSNGEKYVFLADLEKMNVVETEENNKESSEGSQEETYNDESVSGEEEQEDPLPIFNMIELDFNKLGQLSAGSAEKEWLYRYFTETEPVKTNEYTGIFEGYNLIYITAEGFSTYAIDAELTPTLYKLSNSGFVFSNYYVPLWQTSTSDGEYVNLTGLIPDGQFSMKKSAVNNMAYSLPAFFDEENCLNMAYHNNTLSYYDRHLSHPNLGYDFKASQLGDLEESEWGDKIFYMENPGRWPASDLEMFQSTIPEYIQAERFNVYYMTVSGHMNYSFIGNSMSKKNKEAVSSLPLSENGQAYIACHIELDKALEHLLVELENAGKLENTVIALSADHYPYGMTEEQYEELAERDLSSDREIYRNTLILWNGGMEDNVIVTKPCCSVDILPTLLNLFGYQYDSRMYAGRDILSDAEGLVIFNDRSFVTDTVVYDRKAKTTTWCKDLPDDEKEQYMDAIKQEVKNRYNFSAYMLRQDYYDILKQCELEE